MEEKENLPVPATRPVPGGAVRLNSRLADLACWLAPAWSVLCGIVTSESFAWRQGDQWLRLAVLLLLVDGTWGTLWDALASTDWATSLMRWRRWQASDHLAALPYTQPDTPGHRVARWLAQFRSWWQKDLRPSCGAAIAAIAVTLPVGVALSAWLGSELALLSLAALALAQLGALWEGGRGRVSPGWNALVVVLLPWLAGHTAFAPLSLSSAVLALCFAVAYAAMWANKQRLARLVLIAAYALAMALLLALRVPVAATAVGVLLVPQLALLRPLVRNPQPGAWYARYARFWWLAASLLASWAL
ncbi:MAG: hypothetical protein GX601_05305 [Anaerolineales bacterium]|nr:hypothetical protein [Anaerolineales bacterium]